MSKTIEISVYDLEEYQKDSIRVKELEEELKKYKHYYDYEKEELADSCYDFSRENDRLKQNAMEDTKRITELEEENRLLKNEICWLKDHTKYNALTEETYIDGTMSATEAKMRLKQAEEHQNYVSKLEKENKKLKKELECVYKAYHTAMGVDYDSEEDLYTNEDIEGHNVE